MSINDRVIHNAIPASTIPAAPPAAAASPAPADDEVRTSTAPNPNAARKDPITGVENIPPPTSISSDSKSPSTTSPRTSVATTANRPIDPMMAKIVVALTS